MEPSSATRNNEGDEAGDVVRISEPCNPGCSHEGARGFLERPPFSCLLGEAAPQTVGQDRPGIDGNYFDPIVDASISERLRKRQEGAVDRAADREITAWRSSAGTDYVHDGSAGIREMRPARATETYRGLELECESIAPIIIRQRQEIATLRCPCAVDDDVEAPERVDRPLYRTGCSARLAQVEGNGDRRAATGMAARDQEPKRIMVTSNDNRVQAVCGDAQSYCPADASACTRDERDSPGRVVGVARWPHLVTALVDPVRHVPPGARPNMHKGRPE